MMVRSTLITSLDESRSILSMIDETSEKKREAWQMTESRSSLSLRNGAYLEYIIAVMKHTRSPQMS